MNSKDKKHKKDKKDKKDKKHTSPRKHNEIRNLLSPDKKSGRKLPTMYEDYIDFYIINCVEFVNPVFKQMGLSPNMLTTLSFIFSLATCYFIYSQALF